MEPYPRRYRLGLIEASRKIFICLWKYNRHIRGVIASASLKPFNGACIGDELYRYPRRYRLGLIEAHQAICQPRYIS